jgi:tRNA-splicing ligase RtcB
MQQMSPISRIKKAFSRQGVVVDYDQGVYFLQGALSQARVLLPSEFPLEGKAVQQLLDFAAVQVPGASAHVCQACATPDFHPGSLAPVGSVVATTPDMVIPQAIGTDINCGMRLLSTQLSRDQIGSYIPALERRLIRLFLEGARDVPVSGDAFRALFEVGAHAFIDQVPATGIWIAARREQLLAELEACIGLSQFQSNSKWAPEALLTKRETIRDPSLGSIGAGNHFVEFQVVEKVFDRQLAYQLGLREGQVAVMIHSGSRDVGFFVGQRWMDRAKAAWPKGAKHPPSGLYALTGPLAAEYLEAMGVAARYAWLNRVVLGEMVRQCLREVLQCEETQMLVDVPHNVVLQENGLNVHRKGSTPANASDLALIPGSMGDYSYLVRGLGNPEWLSSCSHGAGRSVRRQAMHASTVNTDAPQHFKCLTLREERKIEEAPQAYKPVGPVISSQEEHGLIQSVARFSPWLTVKA